MIRKLFKYDFMSKFKVLLLFIILSITSSLITRILFEFKQTSLFVEVLGLIMQGASISMFANLLINGIMRSWNNFYRSFYKDESYLTHTLPVKKSQLITSRFLVLICDVLIIVFTIGGCLLLMYLNNDTINFIKQAFPLPEWKIVILFILFILLIIIQVISIISSGYLSTIIGNKFENGKIGKSILFGFIIYYAIQLTFLVIILLSTLFYTDLQVIFTSTFEIGQIDILIYVLCVGIIIYIIGNIAIYYLSIKLFNKGVNVE